MVTNGGTKYHHDEDDLVNRPTLIATMVSMLEFHALLLDGWFIIIREIKSIYPRMYTLMKSSSQPLPSNLDNSLALHLSKSLLSIVLLKWNPHTV
jgi:hypothetical protein